MQTVKVGHSINLDLTSYYADPEGNSLTTVLILPLLSFTSMAGSIIQITPTTTESDSIEIVSFSVSDSVNNLPTFFQVHV